MPILCVWHVLLCALFCRANFASASRSQAGILGEVESVMGIAQRVDIESRAEQLEKFLHPLTASMPRGVDGNLELSAVKTAIQRLFMERYAYRLKGFERHGNLLRPPVFGKWLPERLQIVFLQRITSEAFGLHELAVLAASLDHLIHEESVTRLKMAYQAAGLSLVINSGSLQDLDKAVDTYMMLFMFGWQNTSLSWRELNSKVIPHFYEREKTWSEMVGLIRDVRRDVLDSRSVDSTATFKFPDALMVVEEIRLRYGRFQDRDCHKLKQSLMSMEQNGTGRVSLVDFYKNSTIGGVVHFSEGAAYLRKVDVLDESDPENPSVILPNYINSPANCQKRSSDHYSICCMDECEPLMAHLERQLALPFGDAVRIAHLVEAMPSSTVVAPRNLTTLLRGRLDEIASLHAGRIPIHGRLFVQWMHHVYPRECRSPTESDAAERLGYNASFHVTKAEIKRLLLNSDSRVRSLSWSKMEKLHILPSTQPHQFDFAHNRQGAPLMSNANILQDLEKSLGSPRRASVENRLAHIVDALYPIFTAVPKSEHGKLGKKAVRYILHRHFLEKYTWRVKGLEQNRSVAPVRILHNGVPKQVHAFFEKCFEASSFGFHELTVLGALLEELAHEESHSRLREACRARGLDLVINHASAAEVQQAIETFVMINILSMEPSRINLEDVKAGFARLYRDSSWPRTHHFLQQVRQTTTRVMARNAPFLLADTVEVVDEIVKQYGPWQNQDCGQLKEVLLKHELHGSGRILLSDFYNGTAVIGSWRFTESRAQLRHLGALDESDSTFPTLFVANYIYASSNCVRWSSNFYSFCCRDECEPLLAHLERKIAGASASAERIVELVEALPSPTVLAHRRLDDVLRERLDEIAKLHGGHVPLHGRLFAQFMHHAYPRECPFPQIKKKRVTQEKFELTASKAEMLWHIALPHPREQLMTAWMKEEELYTLQNSPKGACYQMYLYMRSVFASLYESYSTSSLIFLLASSFGYLLVSIMDSNSILQLIRRSPKAIPSKSNLQACAVSGSIRRRSHQVHFWRFLTRCRKAIGGTVFLRWCSNVIWSFRAELMVSIHQFGARSLQELKWVLPGRGRRNAKAQVKRAKSKKVVEEPDSSRKIVSANPLVEVSNPTAAKKPVGKRKLDRELSAQEASSSSIQAPSPDRSSEAVPEESTLEDMRQPHEPEVTPENFENEIAEPETKSQPDTQEREALRVEKLMAKKAERKARKLLEAACPPLTSNVLVPSLEPFSPKGCCGLASSIWSLDALDSDVTNHGDVNPELIKEDAAVVVKLPEDCEDISKINESIVTQVSLFLKNENVDLFDETLSSDGEGVQTTPKAKQMSEGFSHPTFLSSSTAARVQPAMVVTPPPGLPPPPGLETPPPGLELPQASLQQSTDLVVANSIDQASAQQSTELVVAKSIDQAMEQTRVAVKSPGGLRQKSSREDVSDLEAVQRKQWTSKACRDLLYIMRPR